MAKSFKAFLSNKIRELGITKFKITPIEDKRGAYHIQFYSYNDKNLFRLSTNTSQLFKEYDDLKV